MTEQEILSRIDSKKSLITMVNALLRDADKVGLYVSNYHNISLHFLTDKCAPLVEILKATKAEAIKQINEDAESLFWMNQSIKDKTDE